MQVDQSTQVDQTAEPTDPELGVTLRDLLDNQELDLGLIAAPEGAFDSPVTWAHITELIDLRMYFRPHELVCTVGSMLLSHRSCEQLVRALSAVGSAGLCLGLGDVHTMPPRQLVESCRRHGLPLLTLPHGVPFLAINEYIARTRVDAAREASARAERLAALILECVTEERSRDELIEGAAETLGGEFRILRGRERELVQGEQGVRIGQGSEWCVAEIGGGEFLHWIGAAGTMPEEMLLQIARAIAIDERKTGSVAHERYRRVGQLVTLIGDRLAHPAALSPDLATVSLDGSRVVVSLWPTGSTGILAAEVQRALIAETPTAVYLFTAEDLSIPRFAEQLSLVCGYSSPVAGAEVDRAIQEARAAFSFARIRGASAGPNELASFDALIEQQPGALLQPFIARYIEPLLAADVRGGAELLATVRAVLEHGTIQEAADATFVHPNTIRYRNQRIKHLIGKDLLQATDRIDLDIAVRAYDRAARARAHR